MDWEEIVKKIPTVIENVRTNYILDNMIIRESKK